MRSEGKNGIGSWLAHALLLLALLGFAGDATAQVAVFGAQQDNTMFSPGVSPCSVAAPALCLSNGIGPHIPVESDTSPGAVGGRRGLVQFDVDGSPQTGGAIPVGSTINSVVLRLHMSIQSGLPGPIAIKPLAQSWGEGTSNSGGDNTAGSGAPATTLDATWAHRFFSSTGWTHPGGTCLPNTACTSAAASAIANIQVVAPNPVTWGSTSQMVADVQRWLDTPSTNSGWIIQTLQGPARFDSMENLTPSFRPTLTVNYTAPPPPMPTITRSPSSFTRNVGFGNNLSADSFTVRNTGTGTLNYTISDNVGFITSLVPSSGSSTGEIDSITVNYNTTALPIGQSNGTITITSSDPGVTNSPRTIAVSVTVIGEPTITRSPSSFTRNVGFGNNLSADSFTVRNTGTGTLNYTISDNVGFITSLVPSSGSSTGEIDSITVNYDTTGLPIGQSNGTITITSSDPGVTNSPRTIAVSVTVIGEPTITRSPSSFTRNVGLGQNLSADSFTVRNSGTGTLNYTISENASFITSLSPSSGSSTGETDNISVNYETSGLPAGVHNGTITITSGDPGVTNSPRTIAVQVTVLEEPTITRSPASFTGVVSAGQNLASDSFTVRNTGTGTLNYTLSDDVGFITSLSPSSGSSTGETDNITVNYDTTGLAIGEHMGTITIASADPGVTNSPQTLGVTVTVNSLVSNDTCAMPTVISTVPFVDARLTTQASVDPSDPIPPCGTGPDGATVWYSVTRPTTEMLVASTAGSNYDTVLSLWDPAAGCQSLVNLGCNNDSDVAVTTSRVQFTANAGTEYRIMVGDRNLGGGGGLLFSLIPEPGRVALMLAALLTLAGVRRSRR